MIQLASGRFPTGSVAFAAAPAVRGAAALAGVLRARHALAAHAGTSRSTTASAGASRALAVFAGTSRAMAAESAPVARALTAFTGLRPSRRVLRARHALLRASAVPAFALIGPNQALRPEPDQVGATRLAQRLHYQVVVLRVAILNERALQRLLVRAFRHEHALHGARVHAR